MSDERRITITHIRRAGHCAAGAREWFEAHDIDFRDFLKNGVSVERLKEINDGFAEQVIKRTYGED